ncbi:MAG: hypothetical protein J7J65_08025 [Candidatus Korarchaeota archaeon]|nr:hypothetical protein [Candidatus Korarchaeota archaeon]
MNMLTSKAEAEKLKLMSIDAVSIMVASFGLRRTSSLLNLPMVVVSRYANGRVLPKLDRALGILEMFEKKYLTAVISQKVVKRDGVIDVSEVLHDTKLLDLIAYAGVKHFKGRGINKVITKEVDGIPLAVLTSRYLGSQLVVAKRRKEPGIDDFIEVRQVYGSGLYGYVYVPAKQLSKGDKVLIVDDVVRTGSTVRALKEAVQRAKGNVVGIFSIAVLRRSLRELNLEVKSMIEL